MIPRLLILLVCIASFTSITWSHQEEFRRIEQARYLFEMEGQSYRALKILNSLDTSSNPQVRANSSLLKRRMNQLLTNETSNLTSQFIRWQNVSLNRKKVEDSDSINLKQIILENTHGFTISKTSLNYFLHYENKLNQELSKIPIECEALTLPINNFIYFNCPDDMVMQLNVFNTAEPSSRRFEQISHFVPYDQGVIIVQNNSVSFLEGFNGIVKSDIKVQGVLEVKVSKNLILIRSKNKLSAYDILTKKPLWSKSNVSGEIFIFSNRFGLVQENGFIQFFQSDGSFIWKLHLDQKVLKSIQDSDSTLVIQTPTQQITLQTQNDNAIYQWISFTKKIKPTSLSQVDSLILIEPGNLNLWESKIALLQKLKGNTEELKLAINKSIEIAQELDNPKTHLLEDYSQTLGAFWVKDLKSQSGFHPRMYASSIGPMYIHSNTSKIHIINPKNGMSIVSSHDSVNIQSQLISDNKFIYSSFKNQIQKRSLNSLKTVNKILLNGEVKDIQKTILGLLVETWNDHIYLIDTDKLNILWKNQFSQTPILNRSIDKNYIISVFKNGALIVHQINTAQSKKIYLNEKNISLAQVDKGFLYVVNQDNILVKISLDNFEVSWRKKLSAQVFSLNFQSQNLLLGLSNQEIILLNLKNGQKKWQWQGKNSLFVKPAILGDNIYIDQGNELHILSMEKGQSTSHHYYPSEIGLPQIFNNKLYLSTRTGILHSFKLTSN
tara:strand:- start:832 stop:2997 length:2166 start_codon:yes stop_codon:yes gene_type:complete